MTSEPVFGIIEVSIRRLIYWLISLLRWSVDIPLRLADIFRMGRPLTYGVPTGILIDVACLSMEVAEETWL
ncbi:hypothetical protein D3C85_1904510 [compost metagenome]